MINLQKRLSNILQAIFAWFILGGIVISIIFYCLLPVFIGLLIAVVIVHLI